MCGKFGELETMIPTCSVLMHSFRISIFLALLTIMLLVPVRSRPQNFVVEA
jgi:hypothetical protein